MNSITSINSYSVIAPTQLVETNKILNGDFTSPVVSDGNTNGFNPTQLTSIPNWVFSSLNDAFVRIYNNLPATTFNAPPNWNFVPVRTVLFVSQYNLNYPTIQTVTKNVSQTINITSIKTYNVSVWAVNGKTNYNPAQNFRILIDGTQVISPISFTTVATTNWAKYTGTYTPSTTGNKVVTLEWNYTATNTNTSSIMVTDIIVL